MKSLKRDKLQTILTDFSIETKELYRISVEEFNNNEELFALKIQFNFVKELLKKIETCFNKD